MQICRADEAGPAEGQPQHGIENDDDESGGMSRGLLDIVVQCSLGASANAFQPEEYANYFGDSGYASS
jgi:hypothetical protein